MAQHDYNIANQSGASFRADLNDNLSAILSLNSGSSEPATRVAYMLWADTTSGQLKQRNAANNAWINKGPLTSTPLDSSGGTITGDLIMSGASVLFAEGADVAAASTANIWATDGNSRHITGNTTITSFGTAPQAGAIMYVIFDGVPLLTQSANLNLNGNGSDIQIAAGDMAIVYADTTTQFDVFVIKKSGSIVNTGKQYKSINQYTGATTLTASADVGALILCGGAGPYTLTLPAVGTVPSGGTISFMSQSATVTLDGAGSEQISDAGTNSNTYILPAGAYVELSVFGSVWVVTFKNTLSLGYNQTWQDVTGSRAIATTYTNTTNKTIDVKISAVLTSGNGLELKVGTVSVGKMSGNSATGIYGTIGATVGPNATYTLTYFVGSSSASLIWSEQR